MVDYLLDLKYGIRKDLNKVFTFPQRTHGKGTSMPFVSVGSVLEKLKNQQEKLIAEVNRCEGLLNNPRFVEKAPQSKVDAEKSKLTSYKMQLDEVKNTIAKLEGNN